MKKILQPIHDKYLRDRFLFTFLSKRFTDTNHWLGAGNNLVISDEHGIFNDAPAAAKYAIQHNDGGVMPLYMTHFPRADSTLGELMVAGYQHFLENDSRGLSNSVLETKTLMERYGASGLILNAHSRGAMTVGNAMKSLARHGNNTALIHTGVTLYGPAFNAGGIADLLYQLSGGATDHVGLQNHSDDFVGSIIGGNPATHSQHPADSNKAKEWIRIFSDSPTVPSGS